MLLLVSINFQFVLLVQGALKIIMETRMLRSHLPQEEELANAHLRLLQREFLQ